MIIGVDQDYNVISVGIHDDTAFSLKIVDEQNLDIISHNYKYVNGEIIDLGLKREFTLTEEEKIKEELTELDKQINRPTEDLYTLTKTTPYKATQDVINRKQELRQELQKLNEGSEVIGTDNPNNEGEIVSTDK